MRVLQAFDLYRFYHVAEEETVALRGVSIYVEAGEYVAVMGPSGSGKSTLLACLAGLDEPDGGYVEFLGRRFTRRPEAEKTALRARRMGIVLQSGNLFNHLSVWDNICLQMQLAGKLESHRVAGLLNLVGLSDRSRALPKQISGGELARAAVAVALANNPQVLLADEPTGEVDAATERRIVSLLEDYRRCGGAAIIATHSEALTARADRIIRLFDGRIVAND